MMNEAKENAKEVNLDMILKCTSCKIQYDKKCIRAKLVERGKDDGLNNIYAVGILGI